MLGWNRTKAKFQELKTLVDELGEDLKTLAVEAHLLFREDPRPLADSPAPNGKVHS
jgi:hypothetical protein